MRLSREPPYASVLWFESGDRNEHSRYPWAASSSNRSAPTSADHAAALTNSPRTCCRSAGVIARGNGPPVTDGTSDAASSGHGDQLGEDESDSVRRVAQTLHRGVRRQPVLRVVLARRRDHHAVRQLHATEHHGNEGGRRRDAGSLGVPSHERRVRAPNELRFAYEMRPLRVSRFTVNCTGSKPAYRETFSK